jgi:hypothetical protein
MAEQDRAIKAGRLVLELHPWSQEKDCELKDPKPARP